jgi:hypothetical protein
VVLAAAAPWRVALAHRSAGIRRRPDGLAIGILLGRRLAQLVQQRLIGIRGLGFSAAGWLG